MRKQRSALPLIGEISNIPETIRTIWQKQYGDPNPTSIQPLIDLPVREYDATTCVGTFAGGTMDVATTSETDRPRP